MSLLLIRIVSFICLLFCCHGIDKSKFIKGTELKNDVFIFNAIGDTPQDGLRDIDNILNAVVLFKKLDTSYWNSITRKLFVSNSICKLISNNNLILIRNEYGIELNCHSISSIKDTRIGTFRPAIEHVSETLYVLKSNLLNITTSSSSNSNHRLLFLTYSDSTGIFPTNVFYQVWHSRYYSSSSSSSSSTDSHSHSHLFNILLFGKNKRLTSVSDWHDLQLIAFHITPSTIKHIHSWINVLYKTYNEYANRQAYNMLEPRPAMIESNLQHKNILNIKYWSSMFIQVGNSNVPIGVKDTVMFHLNCHIYQDEMKKYRFGDSLESLDMDICMNIFYIPRWRSKIDVNTGVLSVLLGIRRKGLSAGLPWGIFEGALRYRLSSTNPNNIPQVKIAPYCWQRSR